MNNNHTFPLGRATLNGLALAWLLASPTPWLDQARAAEANTPAQLVERLRPSLATIRIREADGRRGSLGTGFVVSADGLLATSLHVIGQGREFSVEMSDGSRPKVLTVEAFDRAVDLVLIRVEVDPEEPLQPIPLRKEEVLQGTPILAMGNPLGLLESVVTGVVSAIRTIEGQERLQLAMPVEKGNSGGPVVDMDGKLVGIVNMKSTLETNIAFAIPAGNLRVLMESPSAISIDNWTEMDTLDSRQWTPLFGAEWRQRGGKIRVRGTGSGFGGRALCLSAEEPPQVPFEVGVTVKLADESGAAGLVFHSDGRDRHYGFYPSNGKLRLSCFKGPVVFAWQVLGEKAVAAYRQNDWNELRVRVEADRIQCFANNELVFETRDRTFTRGKVGLAKFRQTVAEFRRFQVGEQIASERPTPEALQIAAELVDAAPLPEGISDSELNRLGEDAGAAIVVLRQRSADLIQQANQLRRRAREMDRLAADVRVRQRAQRLAKVAAEQEAMDLVRGTLELASLEDPELDIDGYVKHVDAMATAIEVSLPADANEETRITALNRYLFDEQGFHGSRFEYYRRANSLMHRVIDDREGQPITLSVLYMELGRRIGLQMEGVGLPGHFVVRWLPAAGKPQLLDVFHGGRKLSRDDLGELTAQPVTDAMLVKSSKRATLERILRNLLTAGEKENDGEAKLRALEGLVALDPESVQYRGLRAVVRRETGRRTAALEDLDWILSEAPEGLDLQRIREMRDLFERR